MYYHHDKQKLKKKNKNNTSLSYAIISIVVFFGKFQINTQAIILFNWLHAEV